MPRQTHETGGTVSRVLNRLGAISWTGVVHGSSSKPFLPREDFHQSSKEVGQATVEATGRAAQTPFTKVLQMINYLLKIYTLLPFRLMLNWNFLLQPLVFLVVVVVVFLLNSLLLITALMSRWADCSTKSPVPSRRLWRNWSFRKTPQRQKVPEDIYLLLFMSRS